MMLLTAAALITLLAVLLRALRGPWIALHAALTLGFAWLLGGGWQADTRPEALALVLLLHILSVNLVTAVAYAWDKHAAKRRSWRVPERTLHALALVGGTPAAYAASRMLRHKTVKGSFRAGFRLVVAVQAAVALLAAYLILR